METVAEKWLPVKGFEKDYEVSNLGRVRSIDRYIMTAGLPVFHKGRLLYTYFHNKERAYRVTLRVRGKNHVHHISTLVAQAFVPNPKGYRVVKHIDGDRKNNSADNLMWVGIIRKGDQ